MAGALPLLVLQLPLQGVADGVAEVGFELEAAQLVEQFGGEFRPFQPLDFEDLEDGRDALSLEGRVGGVVAELGLGPAGLAGADARHQLVEALDLAVAEAEGGTDANGFFRGTGQHAAVVLETQVGGDVITRLGGPVVGRQPPPVGQQALQGPLDVLRRELVDGLLELQSLPLGQVELRPHFEIELEAQRPLLGHLDGVQVDVRLADRRQVLVLVNLREAVHQQRALDPLRHVLVEAMLDQLPRGVPRAKTRHLRRRHQLAVLLVEVTIDVLAGHRHGDVPFAGAAGVDFHVQVQLRLFLDRLLAFRAAGLVRQLPPRSPNRLQDPASRCRT